MFLEVLLLIQNITLPTNVTSLGGFLGWSNTAVNGIFGVGILFALFAIILIGATLKGFDIEITLTAAGIASTLVSLIMLIMKPPLVTSLMPGIFGGITILGVVLLMTRRGGEVY